MVIACSLGDAKWGDTSTEPQRPAIQRPAKANSSEEHT